MRDFHQLRRDLWTNPHVVAVTAPVVCADITCGYPIQRMLKLAGEIGLETHGKLLTVFGVLPLPMVPSP